MSSNPPAIVFDGVSKRYQLGMRLPESLHRLVRGRGRGARAGGPDFWALRDVSFSVQSGEVLGIIGANGAGKTTILKILAGVTKPTRGAVALTGSISALIELGAGFHPELTGRENIYLNGAILGMKRRHIDRILDEIIAFAELGQFIDIPVKRYSSGMYARLGFSVAVYVDPDILMVDEVLSVGDTAFQQKSLERMLDFRKQAKAMVFVSHNLVAVQSICDRVIWLEKGQIRLSGDPRELIPMYQQDMTDAHSVLEHISDAGGGIGTDARRVRIASTVIQDGDGNPANAIDPGGPLTIICDIRNAGDGLDAIVALAIYRQDGTRCAETSSTSSSEPITLPPGSSRVRVTFDHVPLVPGRYYVNVAVSQHYLVQLHHVSYAASFVVRPLPEHVIVRGPVYLAGDWKVEKTADKRLGISE